MLETDVTSELRYRHCVL